jgi:hypothetical protein
MILQKPTSLNFATLSIVEMILGILIRWYLGFQQQPYVQILQTVEKSMGLIRADDFDVGSNRMWLEHGEFNKILPEVDRVKQWLSSLEWL